MIDKAEVEAYYLHAIEAAKKEGASQEEIDEMFKELNEMFGIEEDTKKDKVPPLCECGAIHTSFPKYHLRWCRLFDKNIR